jgi:hypothetical protein
MKYTFPIHSLVGMSPEKISLGLGEILRQPISPVAIEVIEGSAESEAGNPEPVCRLNDHSPGILGFQYPGTEFRVEKQVRKIGAMGIRFLNQIQEPGPDNTPTFPNPADFSQIEVPTIFL